MARKRSQRRKNREKNRQRRARNRSKPDEMFTAGPISFARFGRQMIARNTASESEHQNWLAEAPNNQRQFKATLNATIRELSELISKVDPLSLLTTLFQLHAIRNEPHGDSNDVDSEVFKVDYLHSLATAIKPAGKRRNPSPEETQKAIDLLDRLFQTFQHHEIVRIGTDSKLSKSERELRFMSIMQTSFLRGDSYWAVSNKLLTDLYRESFDTDLETRYGFTFKALSEFLQECNLKIAERVNQSRKTVFDAFEDFSMHLAAYQQLNNIEQGDYQNTDVQDFMHYYKKHSTNTTKPSELRTLVTDFGGKEVFRIDPTTAEEHAICAALSMELGDNSLFIESDEHGAWPNQPSNVQIKPIIKSDGQYYIPNIGYAQQSTARIAEMLLLEAKIKPEEKFRGILHNFTVKELTSELGNFLEGAKIYSECYYEASKSDRPELDIVIQFKNVLILIEVKAGKFRDEAKVVSLKKLKSDIQKLSVAPFKQSRRFLDILHDKGFGKLENKKKEELATLHASEFDYIFQISVTYEQLFGLTTSSSLLRDAEIQNQQGYFWSVSFFDFVAILEVAQSPLVFLHFLSKRNDVQRIEALRFYDELDAFGYYAEHNMSVPKEHESFDLISCSPFSTIIDAYFNKKELSNDVPLPDLPILKGTESILDGILRSADPDSVEAGIRYLSWDIESRENLRRKIDEIDDRCMLRRSVQKLTTGNENVLCVYFACYTSVDIDALVRDVRKLMIKKGARTAFIYAWISPIRGQQIVVKKLCQENQ